MNCHLCGEKLISDNIAVWRVAGRTLYEYACRNKECNSPPNVSTGASVFMHVIMPDEYIEYYLVRFRMHDKWYQVAASELNGKGGTIYSCHDAGATYRPLFELPRFIPMQWQEPLDVQVEVHKNKLKTLIPFL